MLCDALRYCFDVVVVYSWFCCDDQIASFLTFVGATATKLIATLTCGR